MQDSSPSSANMSPRGKMPQMPIPALRRLRKQLSLSNVRATARKRDGHIILHSPSSSSDVPLIPIASSWRTGEPLLTPPAPARLPSNPLHSESTKYNSKFNKSDKPKTKTKTKSKEKAQSPTAASRTFELTPMSGLILQSYTDIAALRALHNANANLSSYPHSPSPSTTKPPIIDFDAVEANLRKFEELYKQHLRYGGRHGDQAQEVHLVAMVCKKGDLGMGILGKGVNVPVLRDPMRVRGDCGF